jgi:hypothetical protein
MLLIIIRIYRTFLKKRMNKTCLFKVSCSHYVEVAYKAQGPKAGWNALWERVNDCQPGYQFTKFNENIILITRSGRIYPQEDLSKALQQELEYFNSKV